MLVERTQYHCEAAYLGGDRATDDVSIEVEGGLIRRVERGVRAPRGARRLRGLTLPGFANAHSHAFHRVLRARTERPGTFWSWRDAMYEVAAALDPDLYHRLARAVFAEMVLAGFSCVGEFHYVHHARGGAPYADRNEMGTALVQAADEAGIRITLVDTCYLERAPGEAAAGVQLRFSDGGVEGFCARVDELAGELDQAGELGQAGRAGEVGQVRRVGGWARGHARVGVAAHSLRAVAPGDVAEIARWAREHEAPFHVHVSEQVAENDAVRAVYGASPVELLGGAGALGPASTAVHATHLSEADISLLGSSGTTVCVCPTTERSLGDGIGPADELAARGSPVALGSDSHAVVDPFEEMRALELDERLRTGSRGCFSPAQLLEAGTVRGHAALGWGEAGRIAPGAPADFVAVSLSSVRLAGVDAGSTLEHAIFCAGAGDVTDVVVSGRQVVTEGRHVLVEDCAGELSAAISDVLLAVGEHAGG